MKTYRSFRVNVLRNGFEVIMGCSTFVFTDPKVLSKAIRDYFADPVATEKKFLTNDLRKEMHAPDVVGFLGPVNVFSDSAKAEKEDAGNYKTQFRFPIPSEQYDRSEKELPPSTRVADKTL